MTPTANHRRFIPSPPPWAQNRPDSARLPTGGTHPGRGGRCAPPAVFAATPR